MLEMNRIPAKDK